MSIIGSLIVSLEARTASFIDGMNAASKTSKTVGREIKESFSDLGGVAEKALEPFGAFGAAIAETFIQVGESAGGAIQAFGKMGGVLGGVAAVGGGAAAAMAAVSVGAIALATSTAESIAKMGELSQSTGVSVQTLSALSFVFKSTGVDADTGIKGIEKLDKAILKAATAPAGTANAFTRLGISVRETDGQIKDGSTVFADLAGKFSQMQDGAVKTALAMELFGRGGAALIPSLNKGKEGIDELIGTATALGTVLDNQTVQAAQQFKESLTTIEAAGQGLSIRLTKELLPALITITDFLVDGLKDKDSGLNSLIDGVAWLTKAFITAGEVIYKVLEQIGVFAGNTLAALYEVGTSAYDALSRATHFDWGGAVAAWQDGNAKMRGIDEQGAAESRKIWGEAASFIRGVWGPLPAARPSVRGTALNPTPSDKSNIVLDTIAKLQAQKDHEAALAASITTVTSANILATAAADANLKIAELEIAAKKKNLTVTAEQKQSIIDLTISTAAYKAIVEDDKAFASFFQKTDEQTASILALADAYATANPEIIRQAEAMAQVAPLQQRVTQLQDLIANFHGSSSDLNAFVADLGNLKRALEEAKIAAAGEQQKKGLESAGREVFASQPFQATQQRIDDLNLLRAREELLGHDVAAIDQVLYDEKFKHLQQYRDFLFQTQNQQLLGNAKIFDSENGLLHQWDEAVFKVGTFGQRVQGVMNELVLQGRQAGEAITRAFLTAIDGVESQLAKLVTGQKTNFKQVATGLAESIAKAEIQKTVGNIAAKLGINLPGVGGKPDGSASNPLHVIIAGGASVPRLPGGLNIPGAAAGGPDGAASGGIGGFLNSILKHFGGGGGASTGGGAGRSGSSLTGILTDFGGGLANKFISSEIANLVASQTAAATATSIGAAGTIPGGGVGFGIGSDFSDILPDFGGFAASGSDVSPGKFWRVNERNEEYFMPHVAGRISPTPSSQGKSGHSIHQTLNFNYPEKPDLFKKSSEQMTRDLHRQTSIALSR